MEIGFFYVDTSNCISQQKHTSFKSLKFTGKLSSKLN